MASVKIIMTEEVSMYVFSCRVCASKCLFVSSCVATLYAFLLLQTAASRRFCLL